MVPILLPLSQALDLMKLIRWPLFAWACLCLGVMAFFTSQWLRFGGPELLVGVALGALFGIPAWLGLPVVAYLDRAFTSGRAKILYLSPLLGAVAIYAGVQAASA